MTRAWQTLVFVLFATWFGGFTFYAGFVVPIGSEVLGSDRAQGFITREVTQALQWVGVAAILALGCEVYRRAPVRMPKLVTYGSLVAISLLHVVLFVLHPWMDALLDPAAKSVADRVEFYGRHRLYLWASGLQWLFALILLFAIVPGSYDARHGNRGEHRGRSPTDS